MGSSKTVLEVLTLQELLLQTGSTHLSSNSIARQRCALVLRLE